MFLKYLFIGLFLVFLSPFSLRAKSAVDHSFFDAQLQKFVKAGRVDYSGWIKEKRTLVAYLNQLAKVNPNQLTRSGQLAYYINLYNATTIKLILDHLPKKIKSIKDISKRWDIPLARVNGKLLSLGHIEHEILRPQFKDARIHFAINCASIGCPDLLERAYTEENIEAQLNQARDRFMNDDQKGVIAKKEPGSLWGENYTLRISKIFNWFDDDFEDETGTVENYILKFGTDQQRSFIRKHKKELSTKYFDYDWNLNGA